MEKQKSLISLIVVMLIILIFLTGILFISTSGQESQSNFLSEQISNLLPLRIFSLATVIVAVILVFYKNWLVKQLGKSKSATGIKLVSTLLYYILIIAVALNGITLALQLLVSLRTQNIQASDLFRFRIIHLIGGTLFCIYLFFSERVSLSYFRKFKTTRIMANHYLEEHRRLFKNNKTEESYKALERACQLESQSLRIISAAAYLFEVNLHDCSKSDECISKAKLLLESQKSINREDVAYYEYCLGSVLYNRRQNTEG